MKLRGLFEGVSDILFHSTGIMNAALIIENNQFRLSADFAKSQEMKTTEPMFFLSTSRSRAGSFHASEGSVFDGTVLFVLDGRKLGNTFKGAAVDYWQMNNSMGIPMNDEMEDRIFSRKREIPSNTYIRAVDVFLKKENDDTLRGLMRLYRAGKKQGIPVRFFQTQQDFLTGRNFVPLSAVVSRFRPDGISSEYRKTKFNIPGRLKEEIPDGPRKMDALRQIVVTGENLLRGSPVHPKVSEIFLGHYGWSNDYYRREILSRVRNEMHNSTRDPIMTDLLRVMRKYKAKTVEELMSKIYERLSG